MSAPSTPAPPPLTAGQLLTADQLSERWQVPRSQVYRLAREGSLPVVQLGRYKLPGRRDRGVRARGRARGDVSVTSNRGPASNRPGVFTTGRENGRRRPRGYAEWNPHAPTRALIDTVAEILLDYREHLPLTVRQIFYRLVASYGYEKDEKAYKRLGEHLVRARRANMVPFGAIRDDGVVTYSGTWYGGPDDFWDDTAGRLHAYRRDRQAGQRLRLELWCEAAGMAPQLARVADHYSVPVYSSGGFASLTAVRLIAERALEREVRRSFSTSGTSTRPASRSSTRWRKTLRRSWRLTGSSRR